MNLREKIKSYSFWVSLGSAIILILKVLGSRFGFRVDETMISDLFTALCSILVIMGIIVIPQPKDIEKKSSINNILSQTILKNEDMTETETNQTDSSNDCQNDIIQTSSTDNIDSVIEPTQDNIPQTDESPFVYKNSDVEITNEQPILEDESLISNQIIDNVNPEPNNQELIDVLKCEKEKYSDNLVEFVKILQDEINSTKNHEEANF